MNDKKNLLAKIIYEARSYKSFEDIEKLVETGLDLSNVPLQPLYVSLLSTSSEQVASILPKLSTKQRQALLDLDLWKRDAVDVFSFEYWLEVYSKTKEDELIKEFVNNEDFLLYLKSRVNIHTFDVEDPQYPDHDNYFLTDDMLLLIEYSQDYAYANELKYFVRHLYDSMGVENAYSMLFKLINESFSYLQETEYTNKKERLREFGFVDYYDARESLHPFISFKGIDRFIEKKVGLHADVDTVAANQSLHSSALIQFEKDMENILTELSKVNGEKRKQYLHFNFVRLINANITLNDALRGGSVEIGKIGKSVKYALELGLQYCKVTRNLKEAESVFDIFDFTEVYKIGNSLWSLNHSKLKKALGKTPFAQDEHEYFLGAWWNTFLEQSFEDVPKVKNFGVGQHALAVADLQTFEFWRTQVQTFKSLAPFIATFYETFNELRSSSKLNDQFYLNYQVEDIDFEALILSSFINFSLGNFKSDNTNKMGLAITELQGFLKQHFVQNDGEYQLKSMGDENLSKTIFEFKLAFGFDEVDGFEDYLYALIYEHLSGYEFDTLEEEDFAHVGGPVLLNSLSKN
tara:strand:- start:2241 stop:3968 length:1728 start_codon:yes stop_codon:yes gene_type:complete